MLQNNRIRNDKLRCVAGRSPATCVININPNIPTNAIKDAIRKVTQTETPSLYEKNRRFHKFLTDGVDVEYQAEGYTKYDKVWLIDFNKPEN